MIVVVVLFVRFVTHKMHNISIGLFNRLRYKFNTYVLIFDGVTFFKCIFCELTQGNDNNQLIVFDVINLTRNDRKSM